jgi:hypothetical protein
MMDRRLFLKLTGLVAAASALEALPVAAELRPGAAPAERADDLDLAHVPSGARLTIREPGIYRISGRVRLEEPLVEISGIADTQWISWSQVEGPERPVAGFTAFAQFDEPGMTPAIRVLGGRLEAVAAVPVDFE